MTVETVIFIHIPKTAGSTLKQIIRRQYAPARSCSVSDSEQAHHFIASDDAYKQSLEYIGGHTYYGIHEYMPKPCRYITFLRDPVERTISEYFYVQRQPSHRLHSRVASGELSLRQFAALREERPTNEHVRRISGVGGLFQETPFEPMTDAALALAKENLKGRFQAFGFVDTFDLSLLLMQEKLGWKHPYYTRVNVTRGRPKQDAIDPATLAEIQAAEALDVELHEYARQLFNQQLAELGKERLESSLSAFQRKNALFSKAANIAAVLPLESKSWLRQTLKSFMGIGGRT